MSLKWIEGFESYSGNITLLTGRYVVNTLNTSKFLAGRLLGSSLAFNGVSLSTPSLGNNATWTVGFGFNNGNIVSGVWPILAIQDGTTQQVVLNFNAGTGLFQVNRGATVLATGSHVIRTGVWYYLEFQTTISTTTGAVTFRVNTLSDIAITSANTQSSGNAFANTISFLGTNQHGHYSLDDIYILDGVATAGVTGGNNTFLGDMKVEPIVPSVEGSNSNWTGMPDASVPNYLDVQSFGDGKFVQANVVGTKDTYTFNDILKIDSNIAGVQVCVWARNTDSNQHTIKAVTRLGGTDYDSANTATITDTSFEPSYFIWETEPDTNASWSVASTKTAEFGMKLMS